MRDLKMRSSVASHQKLTTTNWEPSSKLILLQLHEKLPKNSTFDHSTVVCQLKQTGKIKELGSGCLVSWWKNQNNHRFEVLSSLILQSNNKPFLDQIVMCDEKWVLYHNQWQLVFFCISTSGWTRKKLQGTSQSQTCTPKKVLVTVWWPVAHLIHFFAFWIAAKSLHLRCMLSKSMRCTDNCNAWSQHRSTERAQFFSMTTPNSMSHNQCFKCWMN